MNKKLYFIFIAASFALLVSAPGRMAYGFVLIIEMNLLAITVSAFYVLIRKIDLPNLQDALAIMFIVFMTILYKQLLILFSPVIALNLGFMMYIPAFSVFLLGNIFADRTVSPGSVIMNSILFSCFAFIFFMLRDIFGYGTISFPARNGIVEMVLFDSYATSFLAFFASIPGALLLTIFCAAALLFVQNKMNIIEKSGEMNGSY